MRQIICVTPKELESNFGSILDTCSDICMHNKQDISIVISYKKAGIYQEIIKIIFAETGVEYEYNRELIEKLGINLNTDPEKAKLKIIISKALDDVLDALQVINTTPYSTQLGILESEFNRIVDEMTDSIIKHLKL